MANNTPNQPAQKPIAPASVSTPATKQDWTIHLENEQAFLREAGWRQIAVNERNESVWQWEDKTCPPQGEMRVTCRVPTENGFEDVRQMYMPADPIVMPMAEALTFERRKQETSRQRAEIEQMRAERQRAFQIEQEKLLEQRALRLGRSTATAS